MKSKRLEISGFIYIAQGKRLLKVGKSNNVKARKSALKASFAKYGDSIINFEFFSVTESLYSAERELISLTSAIRKPFCGREWFESGDFDEIIELAKLAVIYSNDFSCKAPRPLSKKRRIALDEARRIEAENAKIKHAEWLVKRNVEKASARFRRTLRRIELECSAMWKRKALTTTASA